MSEYHPRNIRAVHVVQKKMLRCTQESLAGCVAVVRILSVVFRRCILLWELLCDDVCFKRHLEPSRMRWWMIKCAQQLVTKKGLKTREDYKEGVFVVQNADTYTIYIAVDSTTASHRRKASRSDHIARTSGSRCHDSNEPSHMACHTFATLHVRSVFEC